MFQQPERLAMLGQHQVFPMPAGKTGPGAASQLPQAGLHFGDATGSLTQNSDRRLRVAAGKQHQGFQRHPVG